MPQPRILAASHSIPGVGILILGQLLVTHIPSLTIKWHNTSLMLRLEMPIGGLIRPTHRGQQNVCYFCAVVIAPFPFIQPSIRCLVFVE
jgi:hypothetical protein